MINPRYLGLRWVALVVALQLLLIATVTLQGTVAFGFGYGSMYATPTLAALWTVFGPLQPISRIPLSILWLITVQCASAMNSSMGLQTDFAVVTGIFLFGQWAVAQVPMWGIAFRFNMRLQHSSEPSVQAHSSRFQFDIGGMFAVTALFGIALVLSQLTYWSLIGTVTPSYVSDMLLEDGFRAAAKLIMTLPLAMSALLPRRVVPASLLALSLIVLVTELERLTFGVGQSRSSAVILFASNGFQAFWVLAVIGALRLGGYRLVRLTNARATVPDP